MESGNNTFRYFFCTERRGPEWAIISCSAVHMRMFETDTTAVRPLVGFLDFLLYAQPDSDAESTAWPMICEHAHPCPPVPSLDADGAWRWAKA